MKFPLSLIILTALCFSHSLIAERTQFSINEAWEFTRGERSIENVFTTTASDQWENIRIPHNWNVEDSIDDTPYYYRGVAWYRKQLQITPEMLDTNLYVHFEGVNQVAEVYLNGRFVGKHEGGYTAFRFKINDFLDTENLSENQLAVRVDNSHNEDIAPLKGDWTFFGGIYRDVHLIQTEAVSFAMDTFASDGVFITTPQVSDELAELALRAQVTNHADAPVAVRIQTELFDASGQSVAVTEKSSTIETGGLDETRSLLTIPQPKLWSPDAPYLYRVAVRLLDAETGRLYDELSIPYGFRWYSVDAENGFQLNGKAMKLIGASRHQDYPGLGNALPDDLHEADIALLKEMGANFLRVAHYPQDKAVMRACDRLGIITSVEIPLTSRITQSDAFFENCKRQLREMIVQNYNHPSVLIWTYMNEILLTRGLGRYRTGDELGDEERIYLEDVTKLARQLEAIATELNPERYTMIANVKWLDIHHDTGLTTIADIAGWNVYSGWYSDRFANMTDFLVDFHKAQPDTAMLITEYGAGSDIRIRSDEAKRFDFSVEYQNHYHEQYLKAILANDFVIGSAVWNFADFSSETRSDAVPHINSKGVVTWDRQAKDSYYLYKARISTEPVLRVTPTLTPKKTGVEGSETNPTSQDVRIYSNLDEIEVFHNENSLGHFTPSDDAVSVKIDFTPGRNRVEARGDIDGETIRHFEDYDFELIPHNLDALFASPNRGLAELRVNLGAHFWFTDDSGEIWLKDQAYTPGGFGHIGGEFFTIWNGGRIGSHKKIGHTTDDPLYQTQRVGLEAYRFDVPDGSYELTLGFAELLSGEERETLAYNLGADIEDPEEAPDRVFSIHANGQLIQDALNLSELVGESQAFERKFVIQVRNGQGLTLDFKAIRGETALNHIRLKRLD